MNKLKITASLILLSLLLLNCSGHSYLNTAQLRERDNNVEKIALTENGLSKKGN